MSATKTSKLPVKAKRRANRRFTPVSAFCICPDCLPQVAAEILTKLVMANAPGEPSGVKPAKPTE